MSLIIDWHLGLGDAIICNGLVRVIAKKEQRVVLPCWTRNVPSVSAMFADLPNVQVLPVTSEVSYPGALSIGHNVRGFGSEGSFDQEFYRLAGVPFDCRWSEFKIPEDAQQLEPPECPYILVHGDSSEGYLMNDSRIEPRGADGSHLFRVDVKKMTGAAGEVPITAWVRMIEDAEEIHCIDSSFIHLVESVPSNGALFLHSYARPNYFQRRKDWIEIK